MFVVSWTRAARALGGNQKAAGGRRGTILALSQARGELEAQRAQVERRRELQQRLLRLRADEAELRRQQAGALGGVESARQDQATTRRQLVEAQVGGQEGRTAA